MRGDWDDAPVRDVGSPIDAAHGREARVAPAPSADGRVHGRPAPQYGEYAPEGWVNPVLAEQERREQERRERERLQQDPGGRGQRDRAKRDSGAGGQRRPSAAGADRPGAPGADADLPVAMRYGANPTDFVLTIGLLVFGIVSVVRTANPSALASGLRQSLERQFTELSDPAALSTGAVLTVIANVVILLVVAVWTIARLRARKRSFWVPLAGGAVASAFTAAVFLFIVFQDHAFVQYMLEHPAG